MKGLVLHPKPGGGYERGTAEYYFKLLAKRFQNAHKSATIHLEEYEDDSSTEFLADIAKPAFQGLDIFAYIGHGGQHDLYSANIGPRGADSLIEKLRAACNVGAVILFYACNTGRLNDSLLKTIYNNTRDKGFTLYGHSTAGRAGNNPNKTVFPPANGAMLIDQVLEDFADIPVFRKAWNQTMGNEKDNLWATFFLLDNDELFRRACAPALKRAVKANQNYMKSLGWQKQLQEIASWLEAPEGDAEELAVAIARWQLEHFSGKPKEVDGILGPGSWRALKPELT
jgi:hypothetical protein